MQENELLHEITQLVMELAIIVMASWVARKVANKISIPPVVAYIFTGVILGPFLLGSVPFTHTFPRGLFPMVNAAIPVSPQLYAFSTIASIMLLFMSGLETDMSLFIKYSITGSIVGIGGLILSFAGGYLLSIFLLDYHTLHPVHLFMGTIATATSVGITTSVLSDKHKINSPEGVTTLSAAVLDDVLGIVILAIVVSLSSELQNNSVGLNSDIWIQIGLTAIKAVGLWLSCTILGVIFSRKLGKGIKKIIKDTSNISIISLGFAFLLGGIFELVGLSMVIGAYIVGLTLSNTDLSYVIQEKTKPIATFFTPIFFIVTGMLINLNEILHWSTITLGLTYALICILAKIIGAGLPSLLLGFNPLGALRIGVGMAPRGEIALIIAGIGIGLGIIDDRTFGAILIMILTSTLIAPFILNILLDIQKRGTVHEIKEEQTFTEIDLKHENLKRLMLIDFLQLVEEENFFINKTSKNNQDIYQIRKDDIFIVLNTDDAQNKTKLIFQTDKNSISFIKTALYEASTNIAESSMTMKDSLNPTHMIASETAGHNYTELNSLLSTSLVKLHIESEKKEDIILELTDMLDQDGLILEKKSFISEIMEREKSFSTGLQQGIALPHVKTQSIKQASVVIGLKKEGADFDSLDGLPSNIFILIANRKEDAHLTILTKISTLLNSPEFRTSLLTCKTRAEVINLFSQ